MTSSSPVSALPEADSARAKIRALLAELTSLSEDIRKVAADGQEVLEAVEPDRRASATNLIHYLALRRHDLRQLQPQLAALGLSSLGRSEARVLPSVDSVRRALRALERYLEGHPDVPVEDASPQEVLTVHTRMLLGAAPSNRRVRIMVTMPSEAADDYALVHELVRAGMDCMRINCAHDDPAAWARMIRNLKRASGALGRPVRVEMDLAGPKLRTGPLEAAPAVVRIRPKRDDFGRVTAPARVWLTASRRGHEAPTCADASLPVPAAWLRQVREGDSLRFTDARGSRRKLQVVDVNDDGVWTETTRTCYVTPGTRLHRANARRTPAACAVGALKPRERPILLHAGDTLVVTRDRKPGRAATTDSSGQVLTCASIGCTLPEVFEDVRAGDRIWFDDGRIGAVIQKVESDRVVVLVNHARARGEKLGSDKGINLPDSALRLPALTDKDVSDLEFVVRHADMVSLSFANCAADVELLQQHLKRLGGEKLGVILKIETRRGFENLPEMLFTALRSTRCGVMIARGDLAVECGFERLAEIQEEILWVCEAAHVPVIWATQVLENLAKDGLPSRAEITDAAMSERAECVMLNKGPHICQAVAVLNDILQRMEQHVSKKRSMLRELRLAHRFPGRADPGPQAHPAP
jgi:pyruvate kinase